MYMFYSPIVAAHTLVTAAIAQQVVFDTSISLRAYVLAAAPLKALPGTTRRQSSRLSQRDGCIRYLFYAEESRGAGDQRRPLVPALCTLCTRHHTRWRVGNRGWRFPNNVGGFN